MKLNEQWMQKTIVVWIGALLAVRCGIGAGLRGNLYCKLRKRKSVRKVDEK